MAEGCGNARHPPIPKGLRPSARFARHESNAPTGHWPPAQGWRASAYLGSLGNMGNNHNVVAANCGAAIKRNGHNPVGADEHCEFAVTAQKS